jgi:Holliday junction resolvase-like predicted endonuclease
VLTTTPYPWRGAELGGDTLILDLSALLGLRISPWRMSASDMVEELVKQFLERGWRAEQIIPEYRADLRSRGEIDIAILDDDKTLILAVEVKHSIHLSPTVVQGAFQQLSSLATAKWQCVTDGMQEPANAMSHSRYRRRRTSA